MLRLYEPGNYYGRILTFLNTHQVRGPKERIHWRDIKAVLRSFWVMGVVHKGRLAYWRFMTTALFRHPGQIGVAFTLVIMGHHYRLVAEGLWGRGT